MILGCVVVGDSTTSSSNGHVYQAFGLDSPNSTYYMYSPSPAPLTIVTNLAIAGSNIGTLSSQAIGYVDPFKVMTRDPFASTAPAAGHAGTPTGARNYFLSVLIGTNRTSADPVAEAALIGAYCKARRDAGWGGVMVGTIWSRTDIANFDVDYQQPLNAIFRTSLWKSTYSVDAIFDLASELLLGGIDAANNTTYFLDKIHPTIAGFALAAPIWLAGLNAMKPIMAARFAA